MKIWGKLGVVGVIWGGGSFQVGWVYPVVIYKDMGEIGGTGVIWGGRPITGGLGVPGGYT